MKVIRHAETWEGDAFDSECKASAIWMVAGNIIAFYEYDGDASAALITDEFSGMPAFDWGYNEQVNGEIDGLMWNNEPMSEPLAAMFLAWNGHLGKDVDITQLKSDLAEEYEYTAAADMILDIAQGAVKICTRPTE